MSGIASFFRGASPTPTPTISPTPTPTPTPVASPVAEETTGHAGKKTAKQARAASDNAANASKEAAKASTAAASASKQAASEANRTSGSGPTNADVSLESNQATMEAGAPMAAVESQATPSSTPSTSNFASVAKTTPTLSPSGLESSGPAAAGNPAKAAKLIQDIDKIERRIDRKNLSMDDSQRDILAQKLLQEAQNALAQHDSVAAMSLATKASTLLAPLPKLAGTAAPSTP